MASQYGQFSLPQSSATNTQTVPETPPKRRRGRPPKRTPIDTQMMFTTPSVSRPSVAVSPESSFHTFQTTTPTQVNGYSPNGINQPSMLVEDNGLGIYMQQAMAYSSASRAGFLYDQEPLSAGPTSSSAVTLSPTTPRSMSALQSPAYQGFFSVSHGAASYLSSVLCPRGATTSCSSAHGEIRFQSSSCSV